MLNASEQTAAEEAARRRSAYDEDIRRATKLSLRSNSVDIEDLTEDTPPQPSIILYDEKKPAAIAAAKPRTKADRQEEIKERVVNALDSLAEDSTPNTENASMELLDLLCSKDDNRYKLLVKSKAVKGTPAEGDSPKIAETLVKRLKRQKKTSDSD